MMVVWLVVGIGWFREFGCCLIWNGGMRILVSVLWSGLLLVTG